MSELVTVSTIEVKTASGLQPASLSLWHNGHEVPIQEAQVLAPSVPSEPPIDPPVVWKKPLIGISAPNESAFNTIDQQIGYVVTRRTYNTTLPASWAASNAASDVAAGRISYWSWKPNLQSFPTDNAAKTAFSNFLDTIPAGHPCVIAAWHEPEDDISRGDFTLLEWGALQNAFAAIVKSKARPELRTGMCFMGPWTFDTRSGRTAWDWEGCMDWNLIDVVGIDPYRTQSGSTMSLQTMLTVNNSGSGTGGSAPSMMAKIASWGKPVSIMEWGAYNASEASVATFIADAYAWMKVWNQAHPLTPLESALWFNHTLIGSDNPLTGIEIDAYAAIVADSKLPI